MRETVGRQFSHPHGTLGHVAGWIMAKRASNRRRNLWTVELLGIEPEHRVLEIGCGPGIAIRACSERVTGGRVVGIDHSSVMLAQARRRNADAVAQGRVELRLGGLEILPSLEGPFDRVCSANVIQFIPDKTAAYRAIRAVMAPGGRIATTYQPRNRNPTRDDALRMAQEIESHMREAGFVDTRTEELPLRPVPVVCVLGKSPS